MARRKKTRRTRRRRTMRGYHMAGKRSGMGEVLQRGSAASMYVPPLIGGGLTALTVVAIRQLLKPKTELSQMLFKQAPIVGLGIGALAGSLISRQIASRSEATNVTAGAVTGAGLVGLSHVVTEAMRRADVAQAPANVEAAERVAADLSPGNGQAAQNGMGAIVPQYGSLPAGNGMGAIVMEQLSGNRQEQGAVVNLKGAGMDGMVETSAFGTSPYGA
jgi:hypothetical protein